MAFTHTFTGVVLCHILIDGQEDILAWIFHKLALYRYPEWGQCPGG
jgi:hypothetical protein